MKIDPDHVANLTASAKQIAAIVASHPPPQRPAAQEDLGTKLRQAIKAKLPPRPRREHNALSDEETLGQKLARITRAQAQGIRVCRS